MDEPFSALDVATREGLQEEIARLAYEKGKTIVFVTHDIDEAVYLGDRVVALGGQPGEVKAAVPINIPRPRSRQDRGLIDYAAQIKAGAIPVRIGPFAAIEADRLFAAEPKKYSQLNRKGYGHRGSGGLSFPSSSRPPDARFFLGARIPAGRFSIR